MSKLVLPHTTRNKPIHSSIRLEENVLNILQEKANAEDISLNKFVNNILRYYIKSYTQYKHLEFIPTNNDFLKNALDKLNEKDIEDIGKELGSIIIRGYVAYFFPKVIPETLVEYLDIWFEQFQSFHHTWIQKYGKSEDGLLIENQNKENDHDLEDSRSVSYVLHNYTIIHGISINFALVIKSILKGLIEPLINKNVLFKEITSNSISFSFEVKDG